jgi:predicted nucleic acid-binding protein
MRVYFENCSLQRPLDNKTQIRVAIEAEAISGLLALCQSGEIELATSEVLAFEISKCLVSDRVDWALEILSMAKEYVELNSRIDDRARSVEEGEIKPLDALHLASAEEMGADYFCTCDDRLLRRTKAITDLNSKVVSPLELIGEVVK